MTRRHARSTRCGRVPSRAWCRRQMVKLLWKKAQVSRLRMSRPMRRSM
ncbi:MAG TPA: hypothetical protein VG013_05330 [Gemmataceae bacterium]|nr:hypothetical protein [Gemmataceae bacterium]